LKRKGRSTGRKPRPAQALPTPATPHQQTALERERTTKRRGEISELAFALAAARHGFGIAKPYGDSERYDIILDPSHLAPHARPRLVRVQVKSTAHMLHGMHQVAIKRTIKGGGYAAYKLTEVDFIAAYIIPEDAWFIFPLAHILGLTVLLLKPKGRRWRHAYDRYREAWQLLRDPDGIEFA
jgi:PD-(D/E)XK nuclease superfamily protein